MAIVDTDDVLIREFRPADYEGVVSLWSRSDLPVRPRGRDSYENICKQVRRDSVILLVAEQNAGIVGTVLGTHDSRKGWINRLAVDPRCRRKNLATRLVAEVEKWFESNGLDVFACVIETENNVSMELFSKLGYREGDVKYYSKRTSEES